MELFISDLDKTLLSDDAQLANYAKTELNQMIQEGLQFSIATARGHIAATQIIQGLKIQHPIVVANGSFITDYQSGEILMMQNIQDNIKEAALKIMVDLEFYPFVSASNGQSSFLYHSHIDNEGLQWYLNELIHTKDPRRKDVKNIYHALEHKIISFTGIGKKEKVEQVYNILTSEFENQLEIHYYENPYHKNWYWMSIHDINATKEKGVEKLCQMLGASQDKVTVFGDNVNDIPMFRWAKHSIAVANAVDELKIHATDTTNSNEEFGVIQHIRKRFKNL